VCIGPLDNIAAALIGGAMARHVFPKVHIGYLAAIVAASNAGGSGSVVGDTTAHQRERFEMKFHSFCLGRLDYSPNEALFGYAQRVTTGDVPGFPTKSK